MSNSGLQLNIAVQSAAKAGAELFNTKILVVGEMLDAGTATSGALVEDITSKTDANTQFGGSSPLYQAVDLALSIFNPGGFNRFGGDYRAKLNAIGYKIASGTAGVKKIALTGTAVAGKIKVYVASEYKEIEIATTAGEAKADIATKISTALDAIPNQPFTPSVSGDDVVLTASMKGTWFNKCPIVITENTSGLTATVSTTTAGVGVIDISALFTTIATKKFDYIVFDGSLMTEDLANSLKTRFTRLGERNLTGIYFGAITDSVADYVSFVDTYKTHGEFINFIPLREIDATNPKTPALGILQATRFATLLAVKVTEKGSLEGVPNSSATNNRGNPSYRAVSMSDNILLYHKPLRNECLFTESEVLQIKAVGGIIIENNDNNTNAIYGLCKNAYTVTTQGETPVMQDTANGDTIAFITGYIWSKVKPRFQGKTLTSGSVVAGTQQDNVESVIQVLLEQWDNLATSDLDTGIVMGLLPNDPVSRGIFEEQLRGTNGVKANFASGTIEANLDLIIISALKAVFMNIHYNK
jgi:hypothetical protein